MPTSALKSGQKPYPSPGADLTAALPIFAVNSGAFTELVSDALRRDFGRFKDPAAACGEAADVPAGTASNWLKRRATPQGLHLLRLMATAPELRSELMRLIGMEASGDPDTERALTLLMNVAIRRQALERRQRELEE